MNHISKRRRTEAPAHQAAPSALRRKILAWYRKNKRDLPWRRTRDPYRIWISEVMLQQTRAVAVIPYYERFLARFPDVNALARAPEQELLAAWAGLGYYSRARNLQLAARKILELGEFPRNYWSLRNLPGIGEYTAAAISSIAFDLPHAVLDGNVIRVLSRFTGERGNVKSVEVRKRLGEAAGTMLDPGHAGEFNQALMEIGATVCLPREPQCASCPLEQECRARQLGLQNELPIMPARPAAVRAHKRLMIIEGTQGMLMWQRPRGKPLAGFWELPGTEQLPEARLGPKIGQFRHTIMNTTFHVEVLRAFIKNVPSGFAWIPQEKLRTMPLSTATVKALAFISTAVSATAVVFRALR